MDALLKKPLEIPNKHQRSKIVNTESSHSDIQQNSYVNNSSTTHSITNNQNRLHQGKSMDIPMAPQTLSSVSEVSNEAAR